MAIYTPPAPWAGPYPQAVVDNFGNDWIATGPNQLKKPSLTLPTVPDPQKETFKAGDAIPPLTGELLVCVLDADGNTTDLVLPAGTDSLPDNMVGCVQIDEVDGTVAYIPQKSSEVTLNHSDGTEVELDCVQPSLRTCDADGNPVAAPKAFCIAPLLKETCEFKARTGWYGLVAARTGVLSYSLTDPLTGACATVNVDSPVGPIEHLELAGDSFPRLTAVVDSEYSLFLAWAKRPNAFGGCESVVEWRTRMNDFDAVASGQSSVTPFQPADSVAGVFAESPAGTYVTDAAAGQNANVAIINEYPSLDIPAPWGFSAVQFAGDLTTLVVQLRTTEAVKVFRDCDGNFVKAYSGLTGLAVTEAELA